MSIALPPNYPTEIPQDEGMKRTVAIAVARGWAKLPDPPLPSPLKTEAKKVRKVQQPKKQSGILKAVQLSSVHTLPVFMNRRQIAEATGKGWDRISRAAEKGLILADAIDTKGHPLFKADRVNEIAQALKLPEVIA